MMFALAVALGCDIFDSASYALFARNNRYLTQQGTAKLEDLEYFPCDCPSCSQRTPQEVRKMLKFEKERFLAEHNLRVCHVELQTVKQAISDGRLWELVETRSAGHPALSRAFDTFLKYAKYLEPETPMRKKKGPFLTSEKSLNRPEVGRHHKRLINNYVSPTGTRFVVLLPDKYLEPFRQNFDSDVSLKRILTMSDVHLCAYNLTYGVIPNELVDVYPLSQTEHSIKPTAQVIHRISKQITEWLRTGATFKSCMIVVEDSWQHKIANSIRKELKGSKLQILETKPGDDVTSKVLAEIKRRNRKRMR